MGSDFVPDFIVDEIKKVNSGNVGEGKDRSRKKDKVTDRMQEALMRLDTSAFSMSNEIIFGTQPYASVLEAKLLRILVSQLYSKENVGHEGLTYTVMVRDLCKKLGIYSEGTKHSMYERVKRVALALQSRVLFISDGERWRSINWIQEVAYEKGMLSMSLNDRLLPYIKNLGGNFSVLPIDTTMKFTSRYGLRLYEILYARIHRDAKDRRRYYEYKNVRIAFDLDEFRLGLATYGIYTELSHLKKKCLHPAIQEINGITDMTVNHFEISATRHRRMDDISFCVLKKKHVIGRHNGEDGSTDRMMKGFDDLVTKWNAQCQCCDGLKRYNFTEEIEVERYSDLIGCGIMADEIEKMIDVAAGSEYFKMRFGGTFAEFLKNFKKLANGSYANIWKENDKDRYHLSEEDERLYIEKAKEDEEWFDSLPLDSERMTALA